jgi:hypothetical protein
MLSKPWKSTIDMTHKMNASGFFSGKKSYSMVDVRKILKELKEERSKANLPKRKALPVSLWIMDHMINEYFSERSEFYRLDYIEIKKG